MQYFTDQKSVTIKRQVYVNDLSSSTAVSTTTCYFRPLTEQESSENGYQFGIAHNAIFEITIDVRANDKLVIDDVEYTVKGVAKFDHGTILDYVRALVIKPQL